MRYFKSTLFRYLQCVQKSPASFKRSLLGNQKVLDIVKDTKMTTIVFKNVGPWGVVERVFIVLCVSGETVAQLSLSSKT